MVILILSEPEPEANRTEPIRSDPIRTEPNRSSRSNPIQSEPTNTRTSFPPPPLSPPPLSRVGLCVGGGWWWWVVLLLLVLIAFGWLGCLLAWVAWLVGWLVAIWLSSRAPTNNREFSFSLSLSLCSARGRPFLIISLFCPLAVWCCHSFV